MRRPGRADEARRGDHPPGGKPRAPDAPGHEGIAAAPAAQGRARRRQRHRADVLHEPGLPRRHGRVSEQAQARLEGEVTQRSKISSGRSALTVTFGTSTTLLTLRSTATLQIT